MAVVGVVVPVPASSSFTVKSLTLTDLTPPSGLPLSGFSQLEKNLCLHPPGRRGHTGNVASTGLDPFGLRYSIAPLPRLASNPTCPAVLSGRRGLLCRCNHHGMAPLRAVQCFDER